MSRLLFVLLALLPTSAFADGWMHYPVDRDTSAIWPLTQGFYGDYVGYCGMRGSCGTHNAYDHGIPSNTPLYAVARGVVDGVHDVDARSTEFGNAGKWVRIRYDGSTVEGLGGTRYVTYLHMNDIYVSVGDVVDTTSIVGLSGATGGVGPHLHLHVATTRDYCSGPVDPGCPLAQWVDGAVIPGFQGSDGCETHRRSRRRGSSLPHMAARPTPAARAAGKAL